MGLGPAAVVEVFRGCIQSRSTGQRGFRGGLRRLGWQVAFVWASVCTGELIAPGGSFRRDRGNDFFALGVVLDCYVRAGAVGQQSCVAARVRMWVVSQP